MTFLVIGIPSAIIGAVLVGRKDGNLAAAFTAFGVLIAFQAYFLQAISVALSESATQPQTTSEG